VLPAYRFELVELTIHWGHVEAAIELAIGPKDMVDLVVWDHGDYWDTDWVPRRAALRVQGRPVPDGLELDPPSPVAAVRFAVDQARQELRSYNGSRPPLPDWWAPLWGWARATWVALPDPARVCFFPAAMRVIEPDANPPRLEARFVDAAGRARRVVDKEPVIGGGELAGVVEAVRRDGKRWIYRVSMARPWGLETDDGEEVVEVEETVVRWER
jgi:hypothetical protein